MKNIKLIEVPSEIGAGTRGASLGVDAIKIAAVATTVPPAAPFPA